MPQPRKKRLDRAKIEGLLALTLGEQRGKSTWDEAVLQHHVPAGDSYSFDQATGVLDALSTSPGVVGVAARFARARVDHGRGAVSGAQHLSSAVALFAVRPLSPPPPQRTTPTPPPSAPPPSGTKFDVTPFLAQALGEAKAREAVDLYARALLLNPRMLTRDDAVSLLEKMAAATGIIGVTASFAKVRFLLKYPA